MKTKLIAVLLVLCGAVNAQVKIGNNPNTINANSLLELESTNKGFLPPRVALTSLASVSPLTGTVPAGMLVYSSGGSLSDGFYYWSGSEWKSLNTGKTNLVSKTANATLAKTETFVLASNSITLTLPAVTSADNGLEITVKHTGLHTDLISVQGNSGAVIDNLSILRLTKNMTQTYIANNGAWLLKSGKKFDDYLLDVDVNSSWSTLQEVVDFLQLHMLGPTVVRLDDQSYSIDATINIDLPYSVTFQGASFGHATIGPASSLSGKPLFRCNSESYFKMIQFDATAAGTTYGTAVNEDAIRLIGSGTYHEIKDCTFERFYNTIIDSSDAELWLFECDISKAQRNGVLIQSNASGVKVRVAETDFIDCRRGFNMNKGSGAVIQMMSGAYLNTNATDSAIIYNPAQFSFSTIFITANSWNLTGKFIEGFDFSRTDGRDANAYIQSNVGIGDKNPTCNINVLNSATTTTVVTAGTWYKANWTNNSSTTCKWTISNNKITYQPQNRRNGWFVISGNLSCASANRTISLAIVKNGVSTVRYGETTLRITNAGQPFQFSTVVYINDIAPGDYFEVYCTSSNTLDVVTFQDVLWVANTQ